MTTLDAYVISEEVTALFSGDDRWGRDFSPIVGFWKEHVTSDISMSYDQFFRCTSAMIGQTREEHYLNYYLIFI